MEPKMVKTLCRASVVTAVAGVVVVAASIFVPRLSSQEVPRMTGSAAVGALQLNSPGLSVAASTTSTCAPGYQSMNVSSDARDPIASRYRGSILLCLLDRGPNASPRFSTQVINDSPLVWIVNNAPAWSPEATAQESVSVQAFRLAVEELGVPQARWP